MHYYYVWLYVNNAQCIGIEWKRKRKQNRNQHQKRAKNDVQNITCLCIEHLFLCWLLLQPAYVRGKCTMYIYCFSTHMDAEYAPVMFYL